MAVLIGADVAGKLLTDRIHQLENSLTAVETRLEWTLIKKVPATKKCENLYMAVSAILMFVNEAVIKDLLSLDALGIRDPIKQRLQEDQCKMHLPRRKDNHRSTTALKRGQISSGSSQQTCYTSEKLR